jgi:hypothetical protein
MRHLKSTVSGLFLGLAFCGLVMAAPTAPAAAIADCQQTGGEVSALIDAKAGSPNLAAARAAFQIGIMNCMEGDESSANSHYQDARRLLGEPVVLRPAPAKALAPPQIVVRDCQEVGGEVSALIDAKAGSPNLPAARAAFQVGIMQCMEGDYVSAGKHYDDAKKLLSQN